MQHQGGSLTGAGAGTFLSPEELPGPLEAALEWQALSGAQQRLPERAVQATALCLCSAR